MKKRQLTKGDIKRRAALIRRFKVMNTIRFIIVDMRRTVCDQLGIKQKPGGVFWSGLSFKRIIETRSKP